MLRKPFFICAVSKCSLQRTFRASTEFFYYLMEISRFFYVICVNDFQCFRIQMCSFIGISAILTCYNLHQFNFRHRRRSEIVSNSLLVDGQSDWFSMFSYFVSPTRFYRLYVFLISGS